MMDRIKNLVARAPASPDLMVAAVLLLSVAMMILPLPIWLVDLFIGFNLGFAVLILMVALYVHSPLEFSSLPGIILISTVFRLALTITTTRLILSEAHAGDIIQTFGEFVIAGNVVVGLVVFLIVTLVQFIVIAKGSERVAEVAARFTLDALPGKQMAIDAELRNGDIDQHEARQRRGVLESESQLYGAMDGAMKFVKGDAIAGLVVIAVNMIGGIAIGTLTRGLPFGAAVHEYTLLTIGDALISQIPALLLSITAGTMVTRVTGGGQKNLGRDIVGQLSASKRALRLAAFVLLGMAIIPGFPAPVFLVLALTFGAASLSLRDARDQVAAEGTAAQATAGAASPGKAAAKGVRSAMPMEVPPMALMLSPELAATIDADALAQHVDRRRLSLSAELGVPIPEVAIIADAPLLGHAYRVDVEGVPVETHEVKPDDVLVTDDPANLELMDVPYRQAGESGKAAWVERRHVPALRQAGIGHRLPEEVISHAVGEIIVRYASRFIGIQETRALLARLETGYGDLVKEVLRNVPLPRIADVVRRLIDEGVPVNNARLVLEALAEWGEKEHNVVLLAEYVRAALKRQICFRYANAHRIVAAYVIEREAEDLVRSAVRDTAVGPYLVLDERSSEHLLAQVRRVLADRVPGDTAPVILVSMDVRRYVRGFLIRNGLDIAVLSYQDLAGDFTIQPVGSVGLGTVRRERTPIETRERDVLAAG